METKSDNHVMNVGNLASVTIKEWVTMCYACLDKEPIFVNVYEDIEQRKYFSFYDYEYSLNVEKQQEILSNITEIRDGLRECYEWYVDHEAEVMKKGYIQYIDENL